MRPFLACPLAAVLSLGLAACGLGETATSAGAAAKLKAEEIKQGEQNTEQIMRQLNENLKQGAERLPAAEEKN